MQPMSINNNKNHTQKGFTLVEMLVVAPIVILVIGTFIYAIITMTGDVMASRAANVLTYNIQDALNRIEADFKISGGYLPTNSISITSPQTLDSDNINLALPVTTTIGTTTLNKPLILDSYATDSSPLSNSRNIIYTNTPNPCIAGATNITQNAPLTLNTIYFVSSNSLWRRIITPGTTGCTSINPAVSVLPWQQPSCSPAQTGSMCKTNDERLVDGLDTINGFKIVYNGVSGITVTITAISKTAGHSITKSGTISEASATTVTPVNLTFNPTNTDRSGTIQTWTVLTTGDYMIDAYGAQGGYSYLWSTSTVNPGGKGAWIKGTFSLTAGQVINILVGQPGYNYADYTRGGGGGGGTFMVRAGTLLIAAGGGGGAGQYATTSAAGGQSGPSGGSGTVGTFGAGGINGAGGGASSYSGGGCGWLANGIDSSYGKGGASFNNGGLGGVGYRDGSTPTMNGGFGGGGGAYAGGGGGGGYSGGGAGGWSYSGNGGGGGSFNAGTNPSNTASVRTGAGLLTIHN